MIRILGVKFKSAWFSRLIRVGLGIGIAVFLTQFDLYYFDYLTYDIRMRAKPVSERSGLVETLVIDQHTLKSLQHTPNATDHRKLLENLLAQNPKFVVYTIDPTQIVGSYEELEAFNKVASHPSVYFRQLEFGDESSPGGFQLPPPLGDLKLHPGLETKDRRIFAKDDVSRRIMLSYKDNPTIDSMLVSKINGITDVKKYRGVHPVYLSQQVLIDFRPTHTYQPHSFVSNMDPSSDLSQFKGQIVLIGNDNKVSASDYFSTPFSRDLLAMSTVELHANVFDTLLLNSGMALLPQWLKIVLTALISILTIFVVLLLSPGIGLVSLIATAVGFCIVSFALFASLHVVVPMAHPLIAIFVCYYFFIPYRLIMENRKGWEYQQKNKLLTQVEELKSNFLKMMSHDLKTPLARIQGMTEVMLHDSSPLSPKQREALDRIHNSSEELTEFISSILSLNRIESKEIKLQLKSRDVNSLIKDVLKKCSYLAKQKNIEIIEDLEPLFSIRLDEDLLKQVITNLVENAIKYSPENSKVMISTEESDGKILVQVADQGIGIPKLEQENVFVKFYRSKDVTNTVVKGSGLGLYLSKYFVNLHHGDISVESEEKRGSTFTVELPTDLQD